MDISRLPSHYRRFSRHTLWIGRGRADTRPDAVSVVRYGPLELSGSAGAGVYGRAPVTRGAPRTWAGNARADGPPVQARHGRRPGPSHGRRRPQAALSPAAARELPVATR